ncbi:MAG TPA: hypothetical protein VEN81_10570, partial [Planctomycetota bacterium]|nr:hypothetical protein [Planctomycetota bacterium]
RIQTDDQRRTVFLSVIVTPWNIGEPGGRTAWFAESYRETMDCVNPRAVPRSRGRAAPGRF